MPADESLFIELLKTYFPCVYDIKYLMKSCKDLKGGLQDIADDLQVISYSKSCAYSTLH
jgi:CCR4-NOT transcription complex subunit 7/8